MSDTVKIVYILRTTVTCLTLVRSSENKLNEFEGISIPGRDVELKIVPFLYRLHLQGTRTIIDNLDSGYEVIPILTSYEGALDCYGTTLQQEGPAGLYKGFGALVLQFVAHVAVIKLTKFVLTEVSHMLRSARKPPPASSPHPDLACVSPLDQGSSHPARGYSYTQQTYLPDE
jgi:hypothetical protein